MYEIFFSEGAKLDLAKLRARDRAMILDAVEKKLEHSPNEETKARKLLKCLVPPFEAIAPIWELRVSEFRVFYDVNVEQEAVFVRAIRRKPAHKTTEEIL